MSEKFWIEDAKYFSSDEFDSPDAPGSGKLMNPEFIKILRLIREDIKFPIIITSGYRTEEHNAKVGGKPRSAHTLGVACDIALGGSMDRYLLITSALKHGIKRIGIGDSFIHLDMSYSTEHPQNVIWLYPFGSKG